jgi:hypothetical protein
MIVAVKGRGNGCKRKILARRSIFSLESRGWTM